MKAKVNLIEDKLKHKFMNLKGKKFKKSHYPSFKPSHSFSFKPRTSGQKTNGRLCYVRGRNNHLAPQSFNRMTELVKAQPNGNEGNDWHKVNMVELNSNSFRLDSSLPIVNSITFSSDWWLDSKANIYIYTDHS